MKRSTLHPERKKKLGGDCVYVVTCGIENCPCSGRDKDCARGFFSLFLQAVNGIDFSKRHQIPFHINFGNCDYKYSDKSLGENNFWNYYFEQPILKLDLYSQNKIVVNEFTEVYPLRIWHRSYFEHINKQVIQELRFKSVVKKAIDEALIKLKGKRTLGVQVRLTDHGDEIAPVKLTTYLKVFKRQSKNFDQIFVATDDQAFLTKMIEVFGDKVIFNNVTRSSNKIAVHASSDSKDRYSLGLDVLVDCYCLSQCDKLVLVSSNVSYVALLFNPDVPYVLLERFSAKVKRWKTLTLYLLDKWGIRKW